MPTDLNKLSQVFLTGEQESSCGYCKGEGSHAFGLWAVKLTADDYQDLIDRNWRRSGKFLYKPSNHKTCCPLYTIRLDVDRFVLSASQKKVLRQFRNKINAEACHAAPADAKDELLRLLHIDGEAGNRLQVTVERAAFDDEGFGLYQRYQIAVHKDKGSHVTPKSYTRFLVETPLCSDDEAYGTFHMKYRLDGKLICVGVLDILPRCVSSVYLFYDPDYAHLSLGKCSALREIMYTRDLSRAIPGIRYYYMGYYIHTCPKMRYKAAYRPSELLDPHTFTWVPAAACVSRLGTAPYTCLLDGDAPAVNQDMVGENVPEQDVLVLSGNTAMTLQYMRRSGMLDGEEALLAAIQRYASLVGRALATRMLARVEEPCALYKPI